jgi:hypothetical protein
VTISALAPGGEQTVTASYPVHWTTVAGEYVVRATADSAAPTWAVTESDEDNNVLDSTPFPIHRPDLYATSVSCPPGAAVGTTPPIGMAVANLDLGDARPFRAHLVLTRDGGVCTRANLSECDESDDDWWLGTVEVPAGLEGGAQVEAVGALSIPADFPQEAWNVWLVLDWAGDVRESNEGNNDRFLGTIEIGPAGPPLPDLVVTAVTAPSSSGTLASYAVTATVANVGTASAPGTPLSFTLVPTFAGVAPLHLGGVSVPPLAPGQQVSVAATYAMHWTTVAGSYLVRATADATVAPWAIVERDETNNTRDSEPFPVFRPDLFVTSVDHPAAAAPGESAPIAMTIVNQDLGGARPFRANLVLTRDGGVCTRRNLSECDESDDDWWLGTVVVPDGLAGGAQVLAAGSLALPAELPPETWNVWLVLDWAGDVRESVEGNNDRYLGTITVGP